MRRRPGAVDEADLVGTTRQIDGDEELEAQAVRLEADADGVRNDTAELELGLQALEI
jgi:hypothetical protein